MKKSLLTLAIATAVASGLKSQTIWDYTAEINAHISNIPVIFEGRVTSVEIFAGDNYGNKLPNSAIVWDGNTGYFIDPATGERGAGYSKAKIKVCKVYKGDIDPNVEIEVLTRTHALNTIWVERVAADDPIDELKIQYIHTPPHHDPENYPVMLPKSSYSKKLYFCDRVQPVNPANYFDATYYSNFHSFLEMPFNHPMAVPQPDGTQKQVIAYCAIVPYAFDDEAQLQAFLSQIPTINPNPEDFCRMDIGGKEGEVSVAEVNGNPHRITVYPNPSKGDQSIKVKFALESEQNVTITLRDIQGKEIVNAPLGKQKVVMYDLNTQLNSGTYFLQVDFGTKKQTFKVTKH